jgi:hypothetical protein
MCRGVFLFEDLLTISRNSTVGDVARKVMGDVPISYIEGVGGTRVSEDDIVAVGKHDVGLYHWFLYQKIHWTEILILITIFSQILSFKVGR